MELEVFLEVGVAEVALFFWEVWMVSKGQRRAIGGVEVCMGLTSSSTSTTAS